MYESNVMDLQKTKKLRIFAENSIYFLEWLELQTWKVQYIAFAMANRST